MNGKELKIKRIEADLRVKEIARELGITPRYVAMIEKDDRKAEVMRERYLEFLHTNQAGQGA